MTPEQEDALIRAACEPMQTIYDNKHRESIRLAIRAAVAHERERIALLWDGCEYDDVCGFVDIGAAIRRGE